MKRILTLGLLLGIFALFLGGCEIDDCYFTDCYYETDYRAPAVPSGLSYLNGDGEVHLFWNSNYDSDLAGYNVYYAYDYNGRYELLGSTSGTSFVDYGAKNGTTYYYAVTSYDYNGNESELSSDVIYCTPRPEGYNAAINDYLVYPNTSGFSFGSYSVVPYDGQNADFFFENYDGVFYLNVWDDTDIQDMGRTQDLYDIPYAPESGWAVDKWVEAIPGHTYVIWTWDNHFAKIRVKNISAGRLVFDWAFQTAPGNIDLKPVTGNREKLASKKFD
jgi:hypothetical protein